MFDNPKSGVGSLTVKAAGKDIVNQTKSYFYSPKCNKTESIGTLSGDRIWRRTARDESEFRLFLFYFLVCVAYVIDISAFFLLQICHDDVSSRQARMKRNQKPVIFTNVIFDTRNMNVWMDAWRETSSISINP